MRVVIDTNVLVASLINRTGRPARVVKLALEKRMLLLSQALLQEAIEVLKRPYFIARIDLLERAAFEFELAHVAYFVEPTETIAACRDRKDNVFLEVAVSGSALAIVTRRRGSPGP